MLSPVKTKQLTTLITFVIIFLPSIKCHVHDCQQWRYGLWNDNEIVMKCGHTSEKHGKLPDTPCQFPDLKQNHTFRIDFIACQDDRICPNGFRCHFDACFQHKICRKWNLNYSNKTTTPTYTSTTPLTIITDPTTDESTTPNEPTTPETTTGPPLIHTSIPTVPSDDDNEEGSGNNNINADDEDGEDFGFNENGNIPPASR